MVSLNKLRIVLSFMLFLMTTVVFAESSVEFFVSNNTKEINLQTAYERLTGKEQQDLQNDLIDILQKNHIQQGKLQDMLGTYRMSSDQNITADNTERFTTSPRQHLFAERTFILAKQIAVAFNQESVAVFIPNHSTIGDITVSFVSHQPTINELVSIVHDKLPASYSQAYSIHLSNRYESFENIKVEQIEWLGSNIQLSDVQRAFPDERVNYQYGKVFLVYQNGKRVPL